MCLAPAEDLDKAAGIMYGPEGEDKERVRSYTYYLAARIDRHAIRQETSKTIRVGEPRICKPDKRSEIQE